MARGKEFSTSQIAEMLDVSTRTLYRWVEDGNIQYVKTGTGRYQFPESELKRILADRKSRGLDRINDVVLQTVRKKQVVYLRELQVSLEDLFTHEDVTDACDRLADSGSLETESWGGNR